MHYSYIRKTKEVFYEENALMKMELKAMLDNLADAGCTKHDAEIAGELYKNGQADELIRFLKKCRCGLMEEMHESQKKVDCMDFLIRRVERNAAK